MDRIASRRAEIGGGITVDRVLPSRHRRMIGAWCFLDHAGPAVFTPGTGMRVGPHPHIGLQTFTWMIEGEVLHRDSLGNVQMIRPGQVNLMTAGRGIAHTEESAQGETALHAVQLWIALPAEASECPPAFDHYADLPVWDEQGCRFTLVAGDYRGHVAPTRIHSPLQGVDLLGMRDSVVDLALKPEFEYGLLLLEGEAGIDGETLRVNELAYLGLGRGAAALTLRKGSRAIVLGGEPFGEQILLWWNFVGHGKDAIARAWRDWEAGAARFGRVQGYDGPALVAPPLPWPGY